MNEKEKQYFLNFFLHNKSLSRVQMKKRDYLIARDCSAISSQNSNGEEGPHCHRPGINKRYISPKNIQDFLRDYNQDEVLKYTCHLIDTEETIRSICESCGVDSYDFKKHQELICEHFSRLRSRYQTNNVFLGPNMVSLINVYLTGHDLKEQSSDWSRNRISINWNCPQIVEWASSNPNKIPNPGKNIAKKQKNSGFRLGQEFLSDITGDRVNSFSDLVIYFKCLFHIRKDNSLRSIISCVNSREFKQEDAIISFSQDKFNDNVELLTDIDKLIQAYNVIVRMCIDHKRPDELAQIELSYYDDPEVRHTYFCIHHLNSTYNKSQMNSVERIGETQSNLIKNQINGLCDLYVEAEFGDHSHGKINLWDDSSEFVFQKSDEKVQGVKYILRF